MVLSDDIYGKLVFLQFDIGMPVYGFKQAAFNLGTGIILVVEDAELGMAALAVKVETVARTAHVEIDAILHQLLDSVGGFADGHLHNLAVANAIACHQSVLNMLVETVAVVHHSGYSALGIAGRPFGGLAFA